MNNNCNYTLMNNKNCDHTNEQQLQPHINETQQLQSHTSEQNLQPHTNE